MVMPAAPYLMERHQTTLSQRMGDLRANPALAGDGWFRAWGAKYNGDPTNLETGFTLDGFDAKLWGAQIGYDWRRTTQNGQWIYGLALSFGKADLDFAAGGSGTDKGTRATLYGTWLRGDGLYVDLEAGYSWHRGDYATFTDSADSVNTNAWALALEVGKKFALGEKKASGQWYIEPQAQLSWTRFDGYDYTTRGGMRVQSADFDSLIGRLGVKVGFDSTRLWGAYAKISWEKEFKGDLDFHFNGSPVHHTGDWGSDWWTFGLGVSGQFGPNTQGWLEVERSTGGQIDRQWHLVGGLRFEL